MCGIVGLVKGNNKNIIESLLKVIQHRGPDDSGCWESKKDGVVLGSVRLAIQDLSPLGKMPMHSDDGLVHIVFNGEIYNFKDIQKELISIGHHFKSGSDTEVVLKAYIEWGVDCLNKFGGMFALAIYDEKIKKILLARDVAGEKPLFIWKTNHTIVFASELRVLNALPYFSATINPEALSEYLAYGYVKAEQSIYNNVFQLGPGNFAIIDIETLGIEQKKYWQLPKFEEYNLTEEELLGELEVLLKNAIKKQLVADVPVGLFLSGGVDSSLIATLASEISDRKINTFHMAVKEGGKFDESFYAKQIANKISSNHYELLASELTFVRFIKIIETLDQPMADSSYLPTYLISELASSKVKVALGGDGGDELFGGYTHYEHLQHAAKKTIYNAVPYALIKAMPNIPGRGFLLNKKQQHFTAGFKWYFEERDFKNIFNFSLPTLSSKENKIDFEHSVIDSATRFDFFNYLPDDILTKIDRASMQSSLEMRAPFLDKSLIEFAYSKVPPQLKIKNGTKKYLLKKLLLKKLPNFEIERKQGFSLPISDMIVKWEKELIDYINGFPDTAINKNFLIQLIKKEKSSPKNSYKIYNLLVLLIWQNKFKVSF